LFAEISLDIEMNNFKHVNMSEKIMMDIVSIEILSTVVGRKLGEMRKQSQASVLLLLSALKFVTSIENQVRYSIEKPSLSRHFSRLFAL
jgi:hypothetical protein